MNWFALYVPADERFAFSTEDNGGIKITKKQHADLFAGQSAGKIIARDEGGFPVIVDREEEAQVPTCTPYQFHEALNLMGLTDAVNAAAAKNRSIQNAMQFAPEFKRNHPKIKEMAQAIGKTDADIDALFALAVTLNP